MDTTLLPYLTAGLSGAGGVIKSVADDFYVEEIPLYKPGGKGQHIYLTFEKKGLTTFNVINRVAEALGVRRRQIGYAGLKDAQAITRQTISIDNVSLAAVNNLAIPGVEIISAIPHRNKLKVGHLAGNKFVIKIRQVEQSALAQAQSVIDCLAARGAPNYFGEQRFGVRNNTHILGLALIRQDYGKFLRELLGKPQTVENQQVQQARALFDAGDLEGALAIWPQMLGAERRVLRKLLKTGQEKTALYALDRRLKRLFVSAYQSHLFNQLLAQRLNTFHQLEAGDVAYIHQKRSSFVVENTTAEQPRADAFEISPSGPLFGPKYLPAQGAPGERELAMLRQSDISPQEFNVPGTHLWGGRRPYRISLQNPGLKWDTDGLVISFNLAPGGYATMVLREIMKNN